MRRLSGLPCSDSGAAGAPRPADFSWVHRSSEGFQIRPHDLGDAINLRVMLEFLHGGATGAPSFAQRLKRHVQPDLVAELKAVGHRLGRVVDPDRDTFYLALFQAFFQRRTRKMDNADLDRVQPWAPRTRCECYPDFGRVLGGELMKPQGREKAKRALGDALP